MKRKGIALAISIFMLLGFSFSINWEEAKGYEKFFSNFTQQNLAKAPCRVTPKKILEWIKKGEEVILLDIRTPAEASIVGLTYKNSMHIPMSELFKKENLERIPKDKKVVVVCHSGTRAVIATAFLRKLGFNNVYALKGGITGLAAFVTPKTTLGIK